MSQKVNTKTQVKKEALLSDLGEVRKKILEAAAEFTTPQQEQVFLGVWSIKDLLAHLTGWDDTNRKAMKDIRSGILPSFYQFIDGDWKTYNKQLVSKYKHGSLTEIITENNSAHNKLIDSLKMVPAEEFERDNGVRFKGYKVTIARLLQAELKDEKKHYEQIEEFRGKV